MIYELLQQAALPPAESLLALELFTALRSQLSCDFGTFLKYATEGRRDVSALIRVFEANKLPHENQVGLLSHYIEALDRGEHWSPLEFGAALGLDLNAQPAPPPVIPPNNPGPAHIEPPPFDPTYIPGAFPPGPQTHGPLIPMPEVTPSPAEELEKILTEEHEQHDYSAPPPAPAIYATNQRVSYELAGKTLLGVILKRDEHEQYSLRLDNNDIVHHVAPQYLSAVDEPVLIEREISYEDAEKARELLASDAPCETTTPGACLLPIAEWPITLPDGRSVTLLLDVINGDQKPILVLHIDDLRAGDTIQAAVVADMIDNIMVCEGRAYRLTLTVGEPKRRKRAEPKAAAPKKAAAKKAAPKKAAPKKAARKKAEDAS